MFRYISAGLLFLCGGMPLSHAGQVGSQAVLSDLGDTLEKLRDLDKTQKARLLSLVYELRGLYDEAYLRLKQVPEEEKVQDSYRLQELYLAEKLGLEAEVEELSKQLRHHYFRSNMVVKKSLFCTKVERFGYYDAVADNLLTTGKKILIYVEVGGVPQKTNADGFFTSELEGKFEVFDVEDDRSVFALQENQKFNYRSRSELSDYYVYVYWTPQLRSGSYRLVFSLEHRDSGQRAQGEILFKIR